jgi:hypothetical protein
LMKRHSFASKRTVCFSLPPANDPFFN